MRLACPATLEVRGGAHRWTRELMRVNIRDERLVRKKAAHMALSVRADRGNEILGRWLEQNERAKFWLRGMNELRNRGVGDVLLAVVD